MKKVLLVLLTLLISTALNAQTTLSAGDIAIVGINCVDPDDFAFVLLTDITLATVINFTDHGWFAAGGFRSTEGVLTYTAPSNQTAGTVIIYSVSISNFTSSGSFGLATAGDQIIAFQGTVSSPTLIYALNDNGAGVWDADAANSNTSALPTGLTNGTSAVALNEIDNAYYSGGANPDLNALRLAISNNANWTGNNTTPFDFTVEIPNPLPVELTSFSALIVNSKIKLNWRTETEVNNYGFEVERQVGSRQSAVGKWELVGFVDGYGNSNSPKEYKFIDDNVLSGNYAYRLKQIDNDGTFEYSKVIEVDMNAPIGYELSQNYPNPFNPETTIKINVAKAGFVNLSFYNILGERKGIIVNEFKEAGIHTVNFNASELNSGIYFYSLQVESFVETRKMVFLK